MVVRVGIPTAAIAAIRSEFDEFEAEVELEALATAIAIVDTLAETIVPNVPVDTGQARGSFVLMDGGRGFLSTTDLDKAGGRTVAKIKRAVRSLRRLEDVIFDSVLPTGEQLPYIQALEDGHSPQGRAFIAAGLAAVNARFGINL